MTGAYQVRQASNDDVAGVVACVQSVYDEYGFTWEPDGYHADLYHIELGYPAPSGFWVAEEDGYVIGTVGIEVFLPLPGEVGTLHHDGTLLRAAGADCTLCRLYVRANERGRGVGRKLMERAIAEARGRDCLLMEIWSDKRFTEAHGLYRSFGAKEIGERVLVTDPDQSEEFGLILPLNQA